MRTTRRALLVVAVALIATGGVASAATFPAHPVTVPFFSGSFRYGGGTYPYRMVGTNPTGRPATTRVGVEVVPLRFVFANGVTLSGTTRLRAVLGSPVFQPARFLSGTTQYGDAMQRAQFWGYVRRKNWHVLLVPRVLAPVSIRVPAADGWAARSVFGGLIGNVAERFWKVRIVPHLIQRLRLDPRQLTAFVAYHVLIGIGGLGEHGSFADGRRIWSYVEAGWYDPTVSCCAFQDNVQGLSHEIAEWLNNPFAAMRSVRDPNSTRFVDNLVPAWRTSEIACDPYLEVADAVDERPISVDGFSLADVTFLSWFAHQYPSIALGGRYDYLAAFTGPPESCRLSAGEG